MNYTEVQIRQADAALRLMHETKGSVDGHDIYQVMGPPKAEYMRMVLCDVLHLTVRSNNMYALTEEGEKAYEMGFKSWLEERERKKSEPILTRNVEEKRPWWKFKKNDMAHDLFVSVVSIILSQIISLIVFWLSKLL